MFWGSKGPKLLLNALFGPQVHALDSILPTVNIESGLKGFYTVCGGQHSKWCQSERQNQHFRGSEDSVFFPKAGVISQRRETGFLFLTVKLIKMTLSPHQSLVSAVRLASKYPSPTPETSLWQISADVHKTGPHFHSLNIFCINSFLNRTF